MGISISNIVKRSAAFKKSQLANFRKFVDASKTLKAAVKSQQLQAKQDWQTLHKMLSELQGPVQPNGESPIEMLVTDSDYIAALGKVTELQPGFNSSKHSREYIQAFQKAINDYMKQREHADE